MEPLAFGIVTGCALLSAIAVVRSFDLVHAVLWLGVTLFATAVLYAMLGASFLAGVNVLLYVGGVVTLMIFGVMLTRRHGSKAPRLEDGNRGGAAACALALFALVAGAILSTPGLDPVVAPPAAAAPAPTAGDLGRALLHEHVFAFELVSMLLLAVMVGAIVIARRRDPGAEKTPVAVAARAVPGIAAVEEPAE
jgi:NADH-quinone oxidoreductase subunit J